MFQDNQKENLLVNQSLSLGDITMPSLSRQARHSKLKESKKRVEKITSLTITYISSFLGIAFVALLNEHIGSTLDTMLIIGSFGATAVIIFALPDSQLARPWNVICGHFFSSFIGVTSFLLFNDVLWFAAALAVSTAILVMQLTHSLHPPGGATALIAVIGSNKIHKLGYWYTIAPVTTGAVSLVLIAYLCNSILKKKNNKPRKWLKRQIRKLI